MNVIMSIKTPHHQATLNAYKIQLHRFAFPYLSGHVTPEILGCVLHLLQQLAEAGVEGGVGGLQLKIAGGQAGHAGLELAPLLDGA